jgi:probable HAF family extracellular repeat protein
MKKMIGLIGGLLCNMALAQKYEVHDLGDLGGATVAAYGVNAAGAVAGSAEGPLQTDANGNQMQAFSWHAFLWQDGVIRDLGALDGGDSYGTAINNLGEVVGASYLITSAATEDESAVTQLRAVYLASGASDFVSLPVPAVTTSLMRALDINEASTVVGYFYGEVSEDSYSNRGFIWQPDTDLSEIVGALEEGGSSVLRQSNAGQQMAVGYASLDGYTHAIKVGLAEPGRVVDLGTLGGSNSQALAINDEGQMVGWAGTTDDSSTEGFVFAAHDNASMRGIGQLADGFSYSKANDINNDGVIVGTAQASTGTVHYHAVRYDTAAAAPALIDLNTEIDCLANSAERWVLTEATAINDQGYIVGYGTRGSTTRAFLLVPSTDSSAPITCEEAEAAAFADASDGSGSMPLSLLGTAMSLLTIRRLRCRWSAISRR